MPAKTESSAVPRIVRWTDDEWTRIASHLCSKEGTARLLLTNVGEVKAKDVFVAQQVLPAHRQRKLVSIAQGFDGIRTRLSALLNSFPQASHDDFVQPKHLPYRDKAGQKGKTSDMHGPATGRAGRSQAEVRMSVAKETFHPEPQAAYAGSAAVTVDPVPLRHTAQLTNGVAEPTAEQLHRPNGMLEDQAGSSRQKGLPSFDHPTPFPSATAFIRLAQPFIEMVCEEFARAIVSVLSNQEAQLALQTGTPEAPSQQAASTQLAFNERYSEVAQPSTEQENSTQSQSNITHDQPASLSEMLGNDDTGSAEVEVQPLFDPKLPPSANSDFKPNIGVVAAHANDFQELRQLYPQLNLTIVQADCVSDVRCFGHCQRIIALHDEVSQATDELLGCLLRHRYVRLGGGISAIKAQFNAWLHAPGLISSAPERSVPPYGREPVGGMVPKRQNRYPRIIGR